MVPAAAKRQARGPFYAILGNWAGPRVRGGGSHTISYEVGSSVKRLSSSKVVVWTIIAGAALAALPAWAAESKIGVDFQKLGEESPQGKADR